jgi:hypothetical protein
MSDATAAAPATGGIPKGLWFGLSFLLALLLSIALLMPPLEQITQAHLGLLMLALIVAAILLGFPTAFTLMGLGMIFGFFAYYRPQQDWWCSAPTA